MDTSFGKMPVGSVLTNHCGLMPPEFSIYSNLPDLKNAIQYKCNILYFYFKRPTALFLIYCSSKNDYKFKFIHWLNVTSDQTKFIEASTRVQAKDPVWFKHLGSIAL